MLKSYRSPQAGCNPRDEGYSISHPSLQHPTSQQEGTMNRVPGTPAHLQAMGIFSIKVRSHFRLQTNTQDKKPNVLE